MQKTDNTLKRVSKGTRIFVPVLIIVLIIAAGWIFLGGGRGGAGDPIPYLQSCLTDEELAEFDIEKYRDIFEEDEILDAMSPVDYGNFRDWDPDMQCRMIEDILFYETTDGETAVPYDGTCSIDGPGERCYTVTSGDAGVAYMNFDSDYAEHLTLAKLAWHLFVDANEMVPWSLFDYSRDNLRLLFDSVPGQPRQRRQYFTSELYIPETYRIITGELRDPGMRPYLPGQEEGLSDSLVDTNTRETTFNVLDYLGRSLTHFAGSTRITMNPDEPFWPYSARDEDGNRIYDGSGVRVPLDRMPTSKEILIYFEPHHHDPDYYDRAQYHITGGCWATSVLIKNMLASINIPVDIMNNFDSYGGFAGHSGVRFPDLEGQDYYLDHSDDLYDLAWKYGLLETRDRLDADEIWEVPGFSPFDEYIEGYGALHDDSVPWYLSELGLDEAGISRIQREFGSSFGGFGDFASRVLALRSIDNPSIQEIYKRCVSEATPTDLYLPADYLTDGEEAEALSVIDAIVAERRAMVDTDDCLVLFQWDLDKVYFLKTGMNLIGDEDGDGKGNYEDRYPFTPDDDPERSNEFWDVMGIN